MKVRKLRSLFALVTAGLAALVLIQPQSAVAVDTTVSTLNEAYLRLELGTTDRFLYQSNDGDLTQSVGVQRNGCGLTLGNTADDSSLAELVPGGSRSFVGFVDDGIGIGSRAEGSGQPCGRVDPNQSLELRLGSDIANSVGDYAEFDIEAKFGATFRIDAYLDGELVMPDGGDEDWNLYAPGGADSGPDSASLDNFRTRFPKSGRLFFDTLVFSIVGSTGAISLEGGADGTQPCDTFDAADCTDGPTATTTGSLGLGLDGTSDSVIHLVEFDGMLGCDATAPAETSNGISISLTRLENIDGDTAADCIQIPYDLATSLGQVDILKDLLGEDAQFRVVITWPAKTETYPLSASTIDYDGPGGNAPVPLKWCLADGTNDTNTGFPDLPTGHAYCLEKQEATDGLTTGFVTVKETLYGQLDPSVRR